MISKVLAYLEEATRYEVLLMVPYHPLKPWWHKFQFLAQRTVTIYRATYHLPDGVTVRARQPMICAWLFKTISDWEEHPRKKSKHT